MQRPGQGNSSAPPAGRGAPTAFSQVMSGSYCAAIAAAAGGG